MTTKKTPVEAKRPLYLLTFFLKGGSSFEIAADKFDGKIGADGGLTSYEVDGMVEGGNRVIYLNIPEVAAVLARENA